MSKYLICLRFRHCTHLLFQITDIGPLSVVTQKRVRHSAKRYFNKIGIKLVFSSFKIGYKLGVKDPIAHGLPMCLVYKVLCAGGDACHVGETSRHLSTRMREHLVSDRTSHIFNHLHNSSQCRTLCSDEGSSGTLGHASTTVQVKIKEAIHMQWGQPTLNHQLYHVNLKLSL